MCALVGGGRLTGTARDRGYAPVVERGCAGNGLGQRRFYARPAPARELTVGSRENANKSPDVIELTIWRRPTWRGADAHPCAFNYRALPAQVSVIQAGLASGGGWARLTPTVSRAEFPIKVSPGQPALPGVSFVFIHFHHECWRANQVVC